MTRSRAGAGKHDGERGQSLLELALVTPILIILILAIFQFAYTLEVQMGLTNAVREAARRMAATEPDVAPVWADKEAWVQRQLCGNATPCGSGGAGLLADNVQAFDGTRLWTSPNPPTVTFCSYQAKTATGLEDQYRVMVDVKYKHTVFFGLLGYATDAVDGTGNGFWDLSASSQMRLEHIDPGMAGFQDPGPCP